MTDGQVPAEVWIRSFIPVVQLMVLKNIVADPSPNPNWLLFRTEIIMNTAR